MIRLFVPDDLRAGAGLAPAPDQARYLIQVMRLGIGDAIAVFNGRDGEWRAVLTEVARRGCRLTLESQLRTQAAGPDLELVMALVKRGPLETVIEKAAELGAGRVRLVATRRTNADKANLPRLTAIAIEAAEQTGRLDVPEIAAPEKLDRLLDGWDPARRLLWCDESGAAPAALGALADGGPWAILIGPEGGFAPEEAQRLRALPFVVPVSLGPRILRADTAAIAAMTLWQAKLGDWR
ncbi:16S rRNA (uracil1498-N3)-methyltransferase [Caulobacter ginsengisoli]|uniref:Ribosomal RNA small subunit methyltransferase E n=1 Tax=Caulobacter ginsengisoli TaxID=400775 RepID=A0ABU0IRF4_9CAUL|nr:16S rRNA (uracil(1498)-N(3))-methyltransferase [Caulobacter ginsengisoli]MDQ0464554.1 16S rRNA (uracil1498-N3)-methyltransferase [Caulobacter ginsengisoli]